MGLPGACFLFELPSAAGTGTGAARAGARTGTGTAATSASSEPAAATLGGLGDWIGAGGDAAGE